jgi:SWI/SNF-related matrix-associated actin-dependent regulator 1 of chromatin subfamily A
VVFTKFNEFAQRYCAGSRFGWNGSSNPGELHAVLSRLVMIRRLKKDVLTELPAKVREKIVISLQSGEAVTKVKAIRQRMQQMRDDNGGQGGNSMEEKRLMNELYQQSAFAKCRPVAEYVETLLDSSAGGAGDDDDQKFLFFGHHTCMLDSVSEMLRKRKIQFIRIDGSTPSDTRQSLVDKFQNDAHTRVAVLSIKAAGMGLTLTAASVVVFGELSWTPGDIVQAEDRAHRIGQRSCVNVQFLCAKNTVDDIMWGSISNKLETLGQVLDGQKGDTLMLKHAGKGRPAFERTREQRLETLISFGDRSPGGRFVDKPFGFVDGETNGATPKKQATLDAFVAKKPQQPSEKKWAPPPDWDDFDDDSLLHALEANPGKRPRGE